MTDAGCTELGLDDSGAVVSLHLGGALCIDLPETPTTGFRWRVAEANPEIVALDEERFDLSGDHPGAGGFHHFRFRAIGTGSTAIELHRRRQWEKAREPEYSFRVTTLVSES